MSRIPRPNPNANFLSPSSRPAVRSVSAPSSPMPGSSPPHKGRPRANTRIPSPLASPENHAPQSKSYFRPRATSRSSPAPPPRTGKPLPPSPKSSGYTTRRPVPAFSDRDSAIPRAATRKASLPGMAAKLKALPIQSLSTPTPLGPAKTVRARSPSFLREPKPKTKPPHPAKPPEPSRGVLAHAVAPAKALAPRVVNAMSMNVPPHIRLRLRLIHQLSVVLKISPSKVAAVLDVPGLLARVDGVFEKGAGVGVRKREREGSVVSIPCAATGEEEKWWMYPSTWSTEAETPGRGRRGSTVSQSGMLDRLRKIGKKEPEPEEVENDEEVETPALVEVDETNPFAWMGSAFGVPVMELPAEAWCRTRFGGHIHELPLVLYLTIEHIWKNGGIATPGIFRLSGNPNRVEHLAETFARPPLYGDQYPIQAAESPHNMACLLKRWLRDLPEPIVDDALGPALYTFCAEDIHPPDASRITVARILLQLLPPPSFSIMTYLLAFLSQLDVTIENKLDRNAIAIIFGPALLASRSQGVPGLGPRSRGCKDPDAVSVEVDRSQKTLYWLVEHWPKIAQGIMDCAIPDPLAKVAPPATRDVDIDRRLLSPIDLRKEEYGTLDLGLDAGLDLSFDLERRDTFGRKKGMTKSESHTGLGLLSRAFSSRSISSMADPEKVIKKSQSVSNIAEPQKGMKKSQSFTNLGGMLKRTLTGGSRIDPSTIKPITRDLDDRLSASPPLRASVSMTSLRRDDQVTSVLGNLQDLLSAKDRQIERDARELAVLRHTLLELDEKLQLCACRSSSAPCSPALLTPKTPPTPEITITASESAQEIKDSVVLDLQSQLSTAMSALESVRVKSRTQADRILHLEAGAEKTEKYYAEQVKEKDGVIQLEIARGRGWKTERDVAMRRLQKVKEDLFGVTGLQ